MDSKSAALPYRRPRIGTIRAQSAEQLTSHVVTLSVARVMPDADRGRATLAEIAEHPDRISDLPPDRVANIREKLAALNSRLTSRLLTSAARSVPEPGSDSTDQLITVPEAAERLSVSDDWIYKRSDELPFIRKIGPQTTRVSEAALQRWIRDGSQ